MSSIQVPATYKGKHQSKEHYFKKKSPYTKVKFTYTKLDIRNIHRWGKTLIKMNKYEYMGKYQVRIQGCMGRLCISVEGELRDLSNQRRNVVN